MASYALKKSKKKDKKYDLLITEDGQKDKTVSFGASGYEDYTTHHDDERKERYIKRHIKEKSNWGNSVSNLRKPSFLARFVLWNKPSVVSSVRDIENKLGVTIKRG